MTGAQKEPFEDYNTSKELLSFLIEKNKCPLFDDEKLIEYVNMKTDFSSVENLPKSFIRHVSTIAENCWNFEPNLRPDFEKLYKSFQATKDSTDLTKDNNNSGFRMLEQAHSNIPSVNSRYVRVTPARFEL